MSTLKNEQLSTYLFVNRVFGDIQVDPRISTAPEGVYSLNIIAKENSKTLFLKKQVFFIFMTFNF